MIEFVFRPSRRICGKRVISAFYSGRYSLRRGEPIVTVSLETSDERVARKRLRDIVAQKQREAEGIVAPSSLREAAARPLTELIEDYRADLVGRGLVAAHVKESVGRIIRIVRESGWVHLQDIRPEPFMRWRSAVTCSAKTKREYQTSLNAFLNWLVRCDKLAANPLAKVDRVDVRGRAVRKSRAFTMDEIVALCRVAPAYRRTVYLFLTYTGARKNEAQSLRWSDVRFGERSEVLIRAENTKDRDKRAVPLKPELAAMLREQAGNAATPDSLVFPAFPSDDALHADLRRAGIERKDASGRLVHFHAFRKTFQTWGVVAGVGQRAAQELLGHSDPALTANVYTDVAALSLHQEVGKLPWITNAHSNSQDRVRSDVRVEFRDLLSRLVVLAQEAIPEGEAVSRAPLLLAARHGFEP